MDAITYTAACANLARTMNRVCENYDPIIISRNFRGDANPMALMDPIGGIAASLAFGLTRAREKIPPREVSQTGP